MAKIILITGSSRGIGKAIAKEAHKEGYTVVIHGRTNSKELQKTHEELIGSLKAFFDVTNKKHTHKAIGKIISQVGKIDVLVNNAGIVQNFIKDMALD